MHIPIYIFIGLVYKSVVYHISKEKWRRSAINSLALNISSQNCQVTRQSFSAIIPFVIGFLFWFRPHSSTFWKKGKLSFCCFLLNRLRFTKRKNWKLLPIWRTLEEKKSGSTDCFRFHAAHKEQLCAWVNVASVVFVYGRTSVAHVGRETLREKVYQI